MTDALTIDDMKKILPFMLLLVTIVSGWVRFELQLQSANAEITHLKKVVSADARVDFARWQTTVERDILDLRKVCR